MALPVTGVPMGTIIAFGLSRSSLPNGWLLCDGSAIPVQYQALITALGSPYTPNLAARNLTGTGTPDNRQQTDGSTPGFTPDLTIALGSTGGKYQDTLTLQQIPAHQHMGWGGHDACAWKTGNSTGKKYSGANGHDGDNLLYGSTFTGGNIDPATLVDTSNGTVTGTASGPTSPHNLTQPYYAVNYIMYAGS